jgi:hypothetical protein
MIKVIHSSGFTKLPTSEKEALEASDTPEISVVLDSKDSKESKLSYSEQYNNKDNNDLMKNSWFVLFLVICGIIISIWISTELYWLLFEYDIITGRANLTIIINVLDKNHNLSNLLRSLMSQYFSSYEIIITKNFQANYSELPFLKFRRRNVRIKFIQYDPKDTYLKMRIDSASVASGDYILFLDSNDHISYNILNECYKYAIKEKADITQFAHFHDSLPFNSIIHQPVLFDSMFFNKDVIKQNQYHITGKIIKKNVFLESMKDLNSFYLEEVNNILFEESMLTFKLFKNAKSFIKIRNNKIKNACFKIYCPTYLYGSNKYSESEVSDILIYLKFLMENTNKKVYEKRMTAYLFIELLIKKPKSKHHYNNKLKKLLDEIIDLYSKCDLINDYEISLMKRYGDYITYLMSGNSFKKELFNSNSNSKIYIFDQ